MATDFRQIERTDHQRHLRASAADELGIPWPEVFNKAIAPLIQTSAGGQQNGNVDTPYERILRQGLIGCIEGTPSDLSTNKNYMTGYGENCCAYPSELL